MNDPYVLTSQFSEQDVECASLAALAREIVRLRDRWAPGGDIRMKASAFDALQFPGAACVALDAGPRARVGWAIIPGYPYDFEGAARALAAAVRLAEFETAASARAVAPAEAAA